MTKDYIKKFIALLKKELATYFNSPIAYIFIGAFLVAGNWLFFNYFFLMGQTTMRDYFSLLPWIFLFLSPAITMRLWAEEKKSGTIETLLTLPVTNWQVVLAKFFGGLLFMLIALALSFTLPISLVAIGDLDFGPVIGGYLGALFLGGSYLALGMFISSLTKNQIIAFVLGFFACFVAFIVGADFVLQSAPNILVPTMKFLGLGSHFYSIARGLIDSKDIIYYISFIFVFLWLNMKVIETRGWK